MVPLKQTEYVVYISGGLITIYPKPYSIYLRGTISGAAVLAAAFLFNAATVHAATATTVTHISSTSSSREDHRKATSNSVLCRDEAPD